MFDDGGSRGEVKGVTGFKPQTEVYDLRQGGRCDSAGEKGIEEGAAVHLMSG